MLVMLNSSLVTYSRKTKPTEDKLDDSLEDELTQVRKFNIDLISLKTLDPYRKLNDNVVDVYLNMSLDKLSQSLREKVHVFSNFFYSKLKNLPDYDEEVKEKMVRRWDKHVKLFDKNYLVIPICDGGHWFMAIICFAYLVKPVPVVIDLDQQVTEMRRTTPKAAILIFDSLKVKYLPRFSQPIREYLRLRWKFERPDEPPKIFGKESMPLIYAISFKQRNTYDCGVFMLHYFQRFFENPLMAFCRIRDGADLKSSDWEIDCRQKRIEIRQEIKQAANVQWQARDIT